MSLTLKCICGLIVRPSDLWQTGGQFHLRQVEKCSKAANPSPLPRHCSSCSSSCIESVCAVHVTLINDNQKAEARFKSGIKRVYLYIYWSEWGRVKISHRKKDELPGKLIIRWIHRVSYIRFSSLFCKQTTCSPPGGGCANAFPKIWDKLCFKSTHLPCCPTTDLLSLHTDWASEATKCSKCHREKKVCSNTLPEQRPRLPWAWELGALVPRAIAYWPISLSL